MNPSLRGCTNIYSCCGQSQAEAGPGCQTVCRRCGQLWGAPADNCFKKEHTTVSKMSLKCQTNEIH